ncbi:hypothetical protein [Pseudonocardia adelaidensis]|uniref:Uncharacterized protein n=1 Tax=Pseudonocardia adelaidensis TaxID=648754 RepID=A0ABP9NJ04_9PSEU
MARAIPRLGTLCDRADSRNEHALTIDSKSVPPATSPWTFLVPALGAFLGVLLAQWWTTRRENRNWQRQREMYAQQWEDQRERDREQREDQRQRDRELWAREDRHRFTERKRDSYASLLESAEIITHHVSDLLLALEGDRRKSKQFELEAWMTERAGLKKFHELHRGIVGTENYVRLLAPIEVAIATVEFVRKSQESLMLIVWLAGLPDERFQERQETVKRQAVSELWESHAALVKSMRHDLFNHEEDLRAS